MVNFKHIILKEKERKSDIKREREREGGREKKGRKKKEKEGKREKNTACISNTWKFWTSIFYGKYVYIFLSPKVHMLSR